MCATKTFSINTVVTKHGARLRALPQYALEARFLTRVHELISVFTMPAIPTSILRWKLPRGILHANTMPHSMTHKRCTREEATQEVPRASNAKDLSLHPWPKIASDDHDREIIAVSDVYSRFQSGIRYTMLWIRNGNLWFFLLNDGISQMSVSLNHHFCIELNNYISMMIFLRCWIRFWIGNRHFGM